MDGYVCCRTEGPHKIKWDLCNSHDILRMGFWPSFQSYSGYLCFLTHHLTFYALASCYQSVLMYWGALVIFLEYPLFDLFYSVECLLDFQFFPGCNQFSSPCSGTMIYLETVSGNISDMKFDVSQTVKPSSLRFLDSPPFPYWKHHYNGMRYHLLDTTESYLQWGVVQQVLLFFISTAVCLRIVEFAFLI